jgi:hypothetical protein
MTESKSGDSLDALSRVNSALVRALYLLDAAGPESFGDKKDFLAARVRITQAGEIVAEEEERIMAQRN